MTRILTVCATLMALMACSTGSTEAGPAGDPDEVVCCEFGGATGTSTRAKCAEFKGTVKPDSSCK